MKVEGRGLLQFINIRSSRLRTPGLRVMWLEPTGGKAAGRGQGFSHLPWVRTLNARMPERSGSKRNSESGSKEGAKRSSKRRATERSLCQRRSRRSRFGATISELAPALFFLFLFAIFPVLDIIACTYNYCSCVALNDLQLREAAKLPRSIAESDNGPVKIDIPNNWRSTIIGGFSNTIQMPVTDVSYEQTDQGKGPLMVVVSTTCVIQPFLTIPFFPGVPGLGAPLTTTITSKRVLENPHNYGR